MTPYFLLRRVIPIVLLLFLGLVGPVLAGGQGVVIGILNAQSGPGADIAGKNSIVAANLAVEDAGGSVLGVPVKVVFADHLDKADIGLAIARKWYAEDGVDAIFDVPNSSVALAVNGEAGRQKKLVFFSTGGSESLTGENCNGYGLSWTYNSSGLAHASVEAQLAKGHRKWFLLTYDYAIGKSFDAAIRAEMKAQGGEVVGTVFAPLGTTDFGSYIVQATSSGADLIEVALSGHDMINAMKQLREFGVGMGKQAVGALVLIDTDVHSVGASVFSGVESVVAFAWNRTPETRAFANRFAKVTGRMPTMFQAGVYSAVLQYLRAVNAAGSKDSDAVLAALRSHPIEDMFAQHATLRPNGLLVHDMYLVRVRTPGEMKGEWDFYEPVSLIPADRAYPPLADRRCTLVGK